MPSKCRAFSAIASLVLLALASPVARAQSRVGSDSSSRVNRYWHDLGYGAALGFVYAGIDQARDEPKEWGRDASGYGKRLASNVGEFVIQESVTDGLAAVMNRPLDYQHCTCHDTGGRIGWALASAVTDPLPGGHRALAVPRIVGAYAGSFAQASWLPATSNRLQTAIVNGTTSLLIGAAINLFYELR